MCEDYVKGYEDEPQRKRVKLVTEQYEYELPFNYENIEVDRRYYSLGEFHGMELNPVNSIAHPDHPGNLPADAIEITEEHPIVRVVVIGSACMPPGYVQIECEPVEGWRRPDEMESVMPVRFRINGLWGMHLRFDQWVGEGNCVKSVRSDEPYEEVPQALADKNPGLSERTVKADYHEFPLAGMSCANFEIPPSSKVIVMGGGQTPGWRSDNIPDDLHYSFRIIRTTVALNEDYPCR